MSTELIASTSSVAPISCASGTAARRLATAVRSASPRDTPDGGIPASALSSRVPKRCADVTASRTVRRNSSSRPGRERRPRSPPAQLPGAGSNSTSSRPYSFSVRSTRAGSSSWTKRISTRRNPASAAARKRSYTSSSGQSMVRLAAKNRGMAPPSSYRPIDRDAGRVFPEPHQRGHVLIRHAARRRLEEPLLRDRSEQQRHLRRLGLVVNDPEILEQEANGRRLAEV